MSDEGQIYCVADSAVLEDLDLVLNRGESAKVPMDKITGSLDLQKARKLGLVSVMLPKTLTIKPPDVSGNVRAVTRAAVSPIAAPPSESSKPIKSSVPDLGPILGVLHQILEELKFLRVEVARRPTVVSGQPLESISTAVPGNDVPTFIPTIETRNLGNVNVQTTSGTSSGSIDEAMSLLRSKKEKRK